jgi:putative peptidoglycan lipid II flippase
MKKISKLSQAAFLVAASFGINKVLAILRQLIIARQFGLTSDLDVFNVANNIPDLLFALISGGALAVAIIPVMTEVITQENRDKAWRVFSQIANLAFMITAFLSIIVAVFAWPLVQHPLGIAPGLSFEQQTLVVELMRLNLVGTLIFSMAGLVIAGLQANKHFLLPAIAPILYNIGQIYGAIILSPKTGYHFGSLILPAAGLGVHGLVYGVLIGSLLYLLIQIPGLVIYQFKWTPRINLKDEDVRKILVMLGPRVIGIFLYQLTFIARDNMASRLPLGSISALTYGWMILQVPETLIGTAIGTALLPTISELVAKDEFKEFRDTINRVVQVLFALAVPSTILLAVALPPFLGFAFGFDTAGTNLLLWVTRAFLVGLLGHCMIELGSRVFFAQQNAIIPMASSGLNLIIYIIAGLLLIKPFQASGIGLADAIAFSAQALFLVIIFQKQFSKRINQLIEKNETQFPLENYRIVQNTIFRTIIGSIAGGLAVLLILRFSGTIMPEILAGITATFLGILVTLPFIFKEIRVLLHL